MENINGEYGIKGKKYPDDVKIPVKNTEDDFCVFETDENTQISQSDLSFDKTCFQSEEWTPLNSKNNKAMGFLWETGTKTYTSHSGVSITVNNDTEAEIYENKETGEVVVIGAKGAVIGSGSKSAKITVYDSEIERIETSKGYDDIKIYNSNVKELKTWEGTDSVTITDSDIENIETGSGNDFVTVISSDVNKTNTSSTFLWGLFDDAEDTVIIKDTNANEIKTGRGDDNVIVTNSQVEVLNTGCGKDAVSTKNTQIEKEKGTKKDTVVENSQYLDIDPQKISAIESDVQIQIDENNSISVNDYVNYLLNQPTSFETEEEYQNYTLQVLTYNLDSMKSTFLTQEDSDGAVSDGYNLMKELTGLGISDKDIEEMIAKQEEIVNGLTAALNGESDMSFEEAFEYYTGVTYSPEKTEEYLRVSNIYSAVTVGCQYDEDYIDKVEEAVGMSIDEITREYALCQLDTFGRSTGLEDLVEKYAEDQESFKDKLSSVISACGMTCIFAGAVISFVFPPAAGVGMGLMSAGRYISLSGMYIDNVLDVIDDSTDKNGLTKEEFGNLALETGVETVSYAAGRGIGKFTNGLNSAVTSNLTQHGVGSVTSHIAGQATETAVDTALSLAADYAIAQGESLITTGEFISSDEYWSLDRFMGEGKNQLMGILTGLSSEKVNAYQSGIIKIAQDKIISGDIDGAKTYLKGKGMTMSDAGFENFKNSVLEVKVNPETVKSSLPETIKPADTETSKPVETDEPTAETKILSQQTDIEETQTVKINDNQDTGSEAEIKIETKNQAVSDEVIRQRYTDLTTAGVLPSYAKDISKLSPSEFENYEYLVSLNISPYNAGKLAKLNDTQIERAVALRDKGVPESRIADTSVLTGEQGIRVDTLLEQGVNPYYIAKLSVLEPKEYEIAVDLMNNKGVNAPSALDIATKKGSKLTEALEMVENGTYSEFRHELTPEIEAGLMKQAELLFDESSREIAKAEGEASKLIGTSNAKLTARPKGIQSTLNKLISKFEKGAIKTDVSGSHDGIIAECKNAIGDSYGTRIQMRSLTPEETKAAVERGLSGTDLSYDEFMTYMREGTGEENVIGFDKIKAGVMEELKAQQSEYVVQRLISEIESKNINITELNNYGSELSSYFTNDQLIRIAQAYNNTTGKKLTIVTKMSFEEAHVQKVNKNGTYENDYMIVKNKGAEKDSGYTSTQMNVKHKISETETGNGELQIRGTEVNSFGDVEHIPYDIRQGKITAKDVEYREIFDIIINMDDYSYSKYNEYLTATYEWLRLKETGIEAPKPEPRGEYKTKSGEIIAPSDIQKLTLEGLTEFNKKIHG